MKILLLTPIDPIVSAYVYGQLLNTFNNKEVGIVSFPFFAETYARIHDKMYVPSLFAMLQTVIKDKKVHDKIYNRSNILVVGNSYKNEKFDMIVSFGSEEDNTYIKALLEDKDYEQFNLLAEVENLYTWADAEINLPTTAHVKLFLEGVYKKNDNIQPKTTRGN
jgi:hypothetical protein